MKYRSIRELVNSLRRSHGLAHRSFQRLLESPLHRLIDEGLHRLELFRARCADEAAAHAFLPHGVVPDERRHVDLP